MKGELNPLLDHLWSQLISAVNEAIDTNERVFRGVKDKRFFKTAEDLRNMILDIPKSVEEWEPLSYLEKCLNYQFC